MIKLALCLVVLLAGCTTAKPVFLADGTQGHNISCGGAVQSFGDCLAKAGELCGVKGYDVVNREGGAVPFATASGSVNANQGGFQAQSGNIVTRNLFVRCKL